MKIFIRNAELGDLENITKIDSGAYSEIYSGPVGSEKIMEKRIKLSRGWFLVAVINGGVVGYLSLQPTNVGVGNFKSWDQSTDNGTLQKTFDLSGKYVYGVALTISSEYQRMGISEKLFAKAAKKIISEEKEYVYFSGRMPGFSKYSQKMTPEAYYNKRIVRNGREVPLDPQIRMYESYGFQKVRLVKDGFVGDKESCDYSVIFQIKNPFLGYPFPRLLGTISEVIFNNKFLSKFFLS